MIRGKELRRRQADLRARVIGRRGDLHTLNSLEAFERRYASHVEHNLPLQLRKALRGPLDTALRDLRARQEARRAARGAEDLCCHQKNES
jgi:hypothetical protein